MTNKNQDGLIKALIAETQSRINPRDHIPDPPQGHGSSDSLTKGPEELGSNGDVYGEDFGSIDRNVPPWFEPISSDDELSDPTYVPVIDGDVNWPESPQDERQVGSSGTEALAFYAPFHFFGQMTWGIYIRDYGLAYLAFKYKGRRNLSPSDNWLLRAAYYTLLEHENFHFMTELAATRLEVLTSSTHFGHVYPNYFHDQTASWLEEGMANANAHRRLASHEDANLSYTQLGSFNGFAVNWMKTCQPSGYRDYDLWCRTPRDFKNGQTNIMRRMLQVPHLRTAMIQPQIYLKSTNYLDLFSAADYSEVPIKRVHDSDVSWIKTAKMYPKALGLQVFVYPSVHLPEHINVEFQGNSTPVKLGWPDLFGKDRLSIQQRSDLDQYMEKYGKLIGAAVQSCFS